MVSEAYLTYNESSDVNVEFRCNVHNQENSTKTLLNMEKAIQFLTVGNSHA